MSDKIRKETYYPSGKRSSAPDIKMQWWKEKDDSLYQHIVPVVNAITQHQSARSLDNLRYARLYANRDFDNFVLHSMSEYFGRKITFNVCKATIDTACAKIAKAKPRPLFLTTNGNYQQQRRAEKLTQYMDGMFDEIRMWDIGRSCFRDAGIFGTGITKFYKGNGRVCAERAFPDEIVIDELEARDGNPRQLHQRKLAHREVLLDTFPKAADIIRKANPFSDSRYKVKTSGDLVLIIESWHLPSGDGAKDGKHSIVVDSGTIFAEQWDKKYFPFAFQRWNTPVFGFFGEGLCSELVGIQLEINLILQRIKESQELVAIPRVYIENSSQIIADHLTDEIGGVVRYSGSPPLFQTPTAQNREMYDYLEYLYNKAFLISGISQLSASSKKPAGLDSGVALREYQDIESERFAIVADNYQQYYLDSAKIIVDLSRDLAEENSNLTVKVRGRDFIDTIKWKDVDLEDDVFIMSVFPTNLLPRSPEGQLQFTQELIQSGFIEKDEGLSLLNFPDLKGFFSLRTAAIDDIKFYLERMLEHGKYEPPEPFMDLRLALKMAQSSYLRSKVNGIPEARLELLRRFMDQCEQLLSPPEQVAAQAQLVQNVQQQTNALPPAAPGAPPATPQPQGLI